MKSFVLTVFTCLMILQPASSADHGGKKTVPGRKVSMSFVILGDLHYCDSRFYDLDSMLKDKPDDWRQITKTYVPLAEANWDDQMKNISTVVKRTEPEVKCILQLGDVSEGLGNYAGAPSAIAENIVKKLKSNDFGCPWLQVKGNHDITGVGDGCKEEAKSAYGQYYTPFIKEQIGSDTLAEGTYSYETDGVLFVILDAYDHKTDQVAFAKKVLESSRAKYKFVCLHEPVIPATERCWHYLRHKSSERDELLKTIAENKAFVLCGHLHRYSVLRRKTPWGPIVQVMANSVSNLMRSATTGQALDGVEYYGTYLCDVHKPDFNPANHDERHAMLEAEAPFVDYYKMNTLAGVGVISIDGRHDKVMLRYYPAFDIDTPYDEVDLTELYNRP